MNKTQHTKYILLYEQHVSALQRQGKALTTIDVYSRAVRRITEYFDDCPDQLRETQLNRLKTVTVGGSSYQYQYDPLNQRVGKTGGTNVLAYLYSGTQLLAEYKDGQLHALINRVRFIEKWTKCLNHFPGLIIHSRQIPATVYHSDDMQVVGLHQVNNAVVLKN